MSTTALALIAPSGSRKPWSRQSRWGFSHAPIERSYPPISSGRVPSRHDHRAAPLDRFRDLVERHTNLPLEIAGFASPTWFLMLATMALGVGLARSGLLYRAALEILQRLPSRYPILATCLAGLACC